MMKTNSDNIKYSKRRILPAALITAAVLLVLDQWTKAMAAEKLKGGAFVLIPGVFELRYTENHGAAFSMLENQYVLLVVLTAAILAVIVYFEITLPCDRASAHLRILAAVLAAGALGNLIDRVRFHYVRDFLYFRLIDFPIFNVADICVTVSAVLIVIRILITDSPKENGEQ